MIIPFTISGLFNQLNRFYHPPEAPPPPDDPPPPEKLLRELPELYELPDLPDEKVKPPIDAFPVVCKSVFAFLYQGECFK